MTGAINEDFYSEGKRHYGTVEDQSDSGKKHLIEKPKGNTLISSFYLIKH